MTCQILGTTFATTVVVRHGAVSASRPPTDTPSRHAPYGPVPRIVNGHLPAGARNIDLLARREALAAARQKRGRKPKPKAAMVALGLGGGA